MELYTEEPPVNTEKSIMRYQKLELEIWKKTKQ